MILRKQRGYNYILDKRTNLVHDLLSIDSDNCFKTKIVPECEKLTSTIKRKDRKYMTFNEFVASWNNGDVSGCPDCLVGFDKNRKAKK